VAAEDAGLDSVWVYDHLLADGPEQAADSPWEAWTILTALAASTTRIRLGVLVLAVPFRDPGVLARMADTLQEVSANRLVLGIGAGWHQPEFDAFGLPFDHRVSRFEEATQVITSLLRDGRSTMAGRFYRTESAPIRERPDRVPPEILIAAKRSRMLQLTATYADSWNIAWFGVPGPAFRQSAGDFANACEAVGRDPSTVRRTVGFRIAAEDSGQDETKIVRGGPAAIADAISAWDAEGIDELITWPEPSSRLGLDLLLDGVDRYWSTSKTE
jgi:alkanesulfonate monooxygenase SsuD/methylene tetrahydromethanopterin reductase-like flavin-dependent oxidoreductase (luciferase family)